MRGTLLKFASHRWVRKMATGGVGRRVSLRFVAGEHLVDGLRVVKDLGAGGMTASLDHLGENVTDAAAAETAVAAYLDAIESIETTGLGANVSIKLTQLGLDLDGDLAITNADRVASRAVAAGTTVTLDMEDHRYTERTVAACLEIHRRHPGAIGLALQSYLYRTPQDLERLLGVPVRLCKGAYLEPKGVVYPKKQDVDRAYAAQARRLLEAGAYPMMATHDERLIAYIERTAAALGRPRDSWEFQMLYGVRRDLQDRLVREGYRVRIYVPYGGEWYPYLVRRLAERPANLKFFVSQLLRG